jgi:hypothetical protein
MKIKNQCEAGTWFRSPGRESGFTYIQLIITVAVIAVVSTFAMLGIGSARASMRLTGSSRELAGYLEKARADAIRRNGSSTVTIVDANTYRVDMDFDYDGVSEPRTFRLQDGVSFDGAIGLATTFDWRGRVPNQVGIILTNGRDNTSINISGSGDVTLGAEIFQDAAIADVDFNSDVSADVATAPPGASPSATPEPTSTPTPDPTPSPTPNPTPTPTPNSTPTPTPNPTPTPASTPTPNPTPTPASTPTPNPTPTPPACSISAPSSLTPAKNDGSASFSVTVSNANSTTVTATASGDILEVSPGTTIVSGVSTIPYTYKYHQGNGSGSIVISSSCGTKTITITAQ